MDFFSLSNMIPPRCIDSKTIPVKEKAERAFNLGLAALLAENVYNFGEI
ncbi:unnamed protein product, partial [Didymodactylos carnosus]